MQKPELRRKSEYFPQKKKKNKIKKIIIIITQLSHWCTERGSNVKNQRSYLLGLGGLSLHGFKDL